MSYIRLEQDSDGIIELVFDQPGVSVNTMGYDYIEAMQSAVAELAQRVADGGVRGVYLRSGKKSFFGGGDLKSLLQVPNEFSPEEADQQFAKIDEAKQPLRRLETLGVPVAVGINGSALGGGFEICLACHHRVAIDSKKLEVGLPEAQLGLLPGAGGICRTVRLFGLEKAIPWLSSGAKFKARAALEKGWVDQLAADEVEMHAKAKAWIMANPEARQPWDEKGFAIPGGSPADKQKSQALEGLIYFGPVGVMNNTNNNFPAPKAIFACAHDVAKVDFDTAQNIETRYFLNLMTSQTAKNMIRTFFFQLGDINNGASRPKLPRSELSKIGIIGAGQMGAGIAFAVAKTGLQVVLKDINQANADKGKGYAAAVCEKNRRIDAAGAERILGLIHPTAEAADLAGCDIVIEAVFEDRKIKAAVTAEVESAVGPQCIVASNTSALPITELAHASKRPQNFIGMHFFSPAEKMPLVEIISGEQTSDAALATAFDLAQRLGKTPIVVNDAPGFFTTRVIGTTISEGAAMVLEGINPVLIENAAKFNGSPVGPLAAIDEISQATAYKNGQQMQADAEAQGKTLPESAAAILVGRMVEEFDRQGKAFGGGYYDYPEKGTKRIWPGMKTHFAPEGYTEIPFEDIKDRLLFCQSIEAVRAMEEGVVERAADGNVGSIFGIGFPPNTGGVFQFINAYGVRAFAQRAQQLAERYGAQFTPPQLLWDMAERDAQFV
ncbi:3-hydroxyacyl-CoA dehydrogenase NAD-binding domain-containing protein [Ferrimonas pelagia]|uniref:3-hydroxyacyl-CoA dehydrogenase NAD-binding domain-containing protein n=1 Tax=Ferrimonas pelagia TaxID=1177826 RepID=A0ABP9EGV4_9GAMM